MIFSSLFFLLIFLPLTLGVYYIVKPKFKNIILLLFSLIFYAWGEPVYIFLMLFSIVFNYFCGLFVNKNKWVLVFSVVINLAGLFFFKYADFFISIVNKLPFVELEYLNMALPVGISFYTFQAMSYVIDVHRKSVSPQKNIISFGTYISLFPQLIAGPIVRYSTIDAQLSSRKVTAEGITKGILYFVAGLGKKVLIANNIGVLWENVSNAPELSFLSAWLGIIAFALQIYFDFSGYSDMAIGLGKMFGFEFEKNFNYPYISTSITDFWRRWHISLSTWFKEYVYIPLGGNRVSVARRRLNLLIVWTLTGLWHGASFNFVIWGLYYAVLLILEKDFYGGYIEKWHKAFRIIYTMLAVLIGWVFFACENMTEAFRYLGAMLAVGSHGFADGLAVYSLGSYFMPIAVAVIAMLPFWKERFKKVIENNPLTALIPCVMIFMLCIAYLADAAYNPFLYFRF